MAASLKEIEPEERAQPAEALLESLHSPISDIEAAWAREIGDRVAAFYRGETPAYATEDVFAEARHLSR